MKFGPHKFKWFHSNRLSHYIHSYLSWDEEVGGTCSQTDSKTQGWNLWFAERTPHGVKNGLSVQYQNIWTLMINVCLFNTSISIVIKYMCTVIFKNNAYIKKKFNMKIIWSKWNAYWWGIKNNWLALLVFLSFNIYNDSCNNLSNTEEIWFKWFQGW